MAAAKEILPQLLRYGLEVTDVSRDYDKNFSVSSGPRQKTKNGNYEEVEGGK